MKKKINQCPNKKKKLNLLSYMTRKTKVPHISEAGARKCLAFVLQNKTNNNQNGCFVCESTNVNV